MDEATQKIVDMQLVQISESTSPVAMEEGLVGSIENLLHHGVNIEVVTTDRLPSIGKVMRENYGSINHQFDCGHICKAHPVGWKGQHFPSMLDHLGHSCSSRARDFSDVARLHLIAGHYLQTSYHGRFYAKAQNLGRSLKKMYDDALKDHDVIIMPTLPFKAPKAPKAGSSFSERFELLRRITPNTKPFNVTGHPSLSISVGKSEGLPVGMQVTGKLFDDLSVLQVAHVYETIRGQIA